MTTAALDHLEKHLGTFSSVWSSRIGSTIRALRFDDRPVEGASTYATLGLSEQVLRRHDGEAIREELLLCALDRFDSDALGHFLLSLADSLVALQDPLVRGDVMGPSDVIIPGSTLQAVYAAEPTLFEGFTFSSDAAEPVEWIWVLPITASEAAFIQSKGPQEFEALEGFEPLRVLDLGRASLA